MELEKEITSGWGWPLLARKAHWFEHSISLCGKWMFLGDLNPDLESAPDDCALCTRKLENIRAKV